MRQLKLLVFSGVVALSAETLAQDIHFSQFYASPLTLNPALTGFHEGGYRLTGIYRNQWRSVTTPYQTFGASYDMPLLQGKLKQDIFGAGASIVYDKAGDGNLSMMSVMANASYHKSLGRQRKHFIGLGLQLGFVQRSLDANRLTFPEMYNSGTGDFDQPNKETNLSDNTGYFDMGAGLLWSSKLLKRLGVFAGGTIFHLTKPKESFLADDSRLHLRELAHAGLNIKASEHIYITPNVLFMHQNKAKELNFGGAVEYHFKDANNTVVSLGGWWRVDDAPIVSASIEYFRIRLGVAYDVNTSSLTPASNHRGAFEISIIYLGKFNKVEAPVLVPCPRL